MYKAEDIRSNAHNDFSKVVAEGRRVFVEGSTIEEVEKTIENLKLDLYTKGMPKIIFASTYILGDNGEVAQISYSVRPSSNYKLNGVNMNTTFVIDVDANIYKNFADKLATWVDNYIVNSKLVHNVNKLEAEVKSLLKANEVEVPFGFSFQLGNDIVDISDNHVVLGIKPSVASKLSKLGLYDNIVFRREAYKNRIVDFFKEVTTITDIFRIDSKFTRDLELKNRKSLSGMIRKGVTRKVEFLRTGIGYFENETTFAVVERIAVTEDEAKEFEEAGYLIQPNTNPTKREEKADKTKIASKFRLAPFAKKEGEEADSIELASLLV